MFVRHVDRNANSLQALHTVIWYEAHESQNCLHLAVDAVVLLISHLMSTYTTARVESSKNMVSLVIIQRDFDGLMVHRMHKQSKCRELLD